MTRYLIVDKWVRNGDKDVYTINGYTTEFTSNFYKTIPNANNKRVKAVAVKYGFVNEEDATRRLKQLAGIYKADITRYTHELKIISIDL